MSPVYFDISQLVSDPRRTGIQRAERELIRHWPGPAPLIPSRFDPAGPAMRALSPDIFRRLLDDAAPGGVDEDRARLLPFLQFSGPAIPDGAKLLSAELFTDPARAAHYVGPAGAAAYWLVYDFLPWLRPEWFSSDDALTTMPYMHYLRALRSVGHLAFISAHTRDECAERVLRRPEPGPVIPMGADGLGLGLQPFDPARRSFVVLGHVEPRKNSAAVMRAFQSLWANGVDASLLIIGDVAPYATEERAILAELAAEPRFRHRHGLSDAELRSELAAARALLFPSEGEGYGIPPMEALHCGIPVVVAASLPALAGQPALGQLRLDRVTPQTVAEAVRTLLDDGAARTLRAEASRLSLPGWRQFAHSVADWVLSEGPGSARA